MPQIPKSEDKITDDIIYRHQGENKEEVPPTWAGCLMCGKNAIIEKIDIQ